MASGTDKCLLYVRLGLKGIAGEERRNRLLWCKGVEAKGQGRGLIIKGRAVGVVRNITEECSYAVASTEHHNTGSRCAS